MIIDITQELFSGKVYPGDKTPKLTVTQKSSGSRLSDFECCAHNATHIDAPNHFVPAAGDIESIPPEKCIGTCAVVSSALDAIAASQKYKKIILRGQIDKTAAGKLTGLDLIGTDEQSIGDAETHRTLLVKNVVVLEGLALDHVADGIYKLIALPLRLRGADGSPVRAVLVKE